jgi:hypothetical protein
MNKQKIWDYMKALYLPEVGCDWTHVNTSQSAASHLTEIVNNLPLNGTGSIGQRKDRASTQTSWAHVREALISNLSRVISWAFREFPQPLQTSSSTSQLLTSQDSLPPGSSHSKAEGTEQTMKIYSGITLTANQ